jgi:transcriptional regulator with XRE-family HTH domain
MGFKERLKRMRVEAGLTQAALAARAGLASATIGHLETGKRSPAWETVQRLCNALGVSCETMRDDDTLFAPSSDPDRSNVQERG